MVVEEKSKHIVEDLKIKEEVVPDVTTKADAVDAPVGWPEEEEIDLGDLEEPKKEP